MKWASKGKHPEMIFDFLRDSGSMIVIPELDLLKGTVQDSHWHPEGDVEIHTKWVIKRMFDICERENITGEERVVFIFAALFHDIAKPQTTEISFSEKHQRICVTSNRHDVEGAKMTEEILLRIGIKPVIVEKVVKLVKFHLAHTSLFSIDSLRSQKSALLKLSKNLNPATISDVLLLIEADTLGRGDVDSERILRVQEEIKEIRDLADTLHVTTEERKPILMGRHLIELGMKPGQEFGRILKLADEAQDNLDFTTLKGAKLWLDHELNPSIKTKVKVLWGKLRKW
jgi:tRNA nucleotidyltransferase (CCA-adding enzyme)